MEQRRQFVLPAKSGECTVTEPCERFGISRKTAYKWISRHGERGSERLADRSRAPKHSPQRTAGEIERLVTARRLEHPAWGRRSSTGCWSGTTGWRSLPPGAPSARYSSATG